MNIQWNGEFGLRYEGLEIQWLQNNITTAGIDLVLRMMSRETTEGWNSIRAILNGGGQVTKVAGVDAQTANDRVESRAVFLASELTAEVVELQMIGNEGTVIATRAVSIPAGETVEIVRRDSLAANT